MLRLENLTRKDITLYVWETLEQNDLFDHLRKGEDARSVELVNEVVSKGQGVFLWVFLVVQSLITGLTNADRITDLRRRLRHLPADLESYFAHMFATIDTFYEQQTAQTFQIALHVSEPQNIMTYVMLDELDEDPQFALNLDIREWQSNEIRSKTESMELRINARGMGLLEVVRSKNWHILFWDIANGWANAPDEERILQLETINTLLVAREYPREAFDIACWTSLLTMLPGNWLSGSIELQRALKTTMSLLLEPVSGSDPVDGKSILWRNIMLEIEKRPNIGPASMEIILEIIITSLRNGASPDANHVDVISALWRDPYFSTEQKAELRAVLPLVRINHLKLPYRRNSIPHQISDNPGRSSKRSAPDYDSDYDSADETCLPIQEPVERPFKLTTDLWSPDGIGSVLIVEPLDLQRSLFLDILDGE